MQQTTVYFVFVIVCQVLALYDCPQAYSFIAGGEAGLERFSLLITLQSLHLSVLQPELMERSADGHTAGCQLCSVQSDNTAQCTSSLFPRKWTAGILYCREDRCLHVYCFIPHQEEKFSLRVLGNRAVTMEARGKEQQAYWRQNRLAGYQFSEDERRLESVAVRCNHPGHLQSCNMSLCTHISLHQCLDQNAFIGSVYSPAGAVSIQTISNSMSVA
ncbi:hypothetical protein F7725_008108, partial [Dissostichus mawsoni]